MTQPSLVRPAPAGRHPHPPTRFGPGPIDLKPIEPTNETRLDRLVHEHYRAVLFQTVKMTAGDRAWAEDVVQETMIRAWKRLDRMTAEHGSVRSWLLRVAHNLVVDGYRARRRTEVELDSDHADTHAAPDDTDQVLTTVMVVEALANLPEAQRDVIEEVYLRDRSMVDAAQLLELPVGTVKSRAFYALRRLRAVLSLSSQ